MFKSKGENKKGMTVIETLVAVFLLTMAVTGPLALASKGIAYSEYAKDEITAFFLAQEGIDSVRAIRDFYTTSSSYCNSFGGQPGSIGGCDSSSNKLKEGDYNLDVWANPPSLKDSFFSGSDFTLKERPISNNGFVIGNAFTSAPPLIGSNDEPSKFSRKITITEINTNEIRVDVKVFWDSRGGLEREVVLSENLFNFK